MSAMSDLMIERMNITRYYSRVDRDYWTAGNKSEAQAKTAGREMSRRIVPADKVDDFVAEFMSRIGAVNKANPRCKPLHAYSGRSLDPTSHDIFIRIDGITHLELAWVKD